MSEKNAPEPAEPRVITVGWQLPALLIVGIVVLVGAYFLGRGGGTAAPAESVVVVANPTADALATQVALGGGLQVVGPEQGIGGDEVVPMQERYHPLTDTRAPDFQMQVLGSEEKVRLHDLEGKPVLVNFWATWCPPCRLEMPWLEEAARQRQAQNLVVLAVNAGERVAAEQVRDLVHTYVTGAGLTFPVLLPSDPDRSQYDYQAFNLPTSFLVDPGGTVRTVVNGAFPNRASLNAQLDAFLAGRPGQ